MSSIRSLPSTTDASEVSQYIAEFEGSQRIAKALASFIGYALERLPARSYDLLVDNYHLAGRGLTFRKGSPPDFTTAKARQAALSRARRRFLRELKDLLDEAASVNPELRSLQDAMAFVSGSKTACEIGSMWPPPASVEIIDASELQNSSIVLPVSRELIDYFATHPEALHLISPREFESLSARILDAFGYRVEMGPLGRDGGVDIYAERISRIGRELVLVQCKHYRPDRKVGEPIIKQLYAEVVGRRATRGLVVTSSFFTSTALSYIEINKYCLEGADNARITAWLSELSVSDAEVEAPNPVGRADG